MGDAYVYPSSKIVPTFTATIYVGFWDRDAKEYAGTYSDATAICQAYCDEVGLCVSVRLVDYIYTHGGEMGAEIGLINYPRFPSLPDRIRDHALELAKRLRERFRQYKVTVVFPEYTVMIGGEGA